MEKKEKRDTRGYRGREREGHFGVVIGGFPRAEVGTVCPSLATWLLARMRMPEGSRRGKVAGWREHASELRFPEDSWEPSTGGNGVFAAVRQVTKPAGHTHTSHF